MIVIRQNKPLPLLSANQHFPFALLSSCRGNIAPSVRPKEVGSQNTALLDLHSPLCGHGGLDVTPRATFWNVPAGLRLLPSLCFLSPIPHPHRAMSSSPLPPGTGVTFSRGLWLIYRVEAFPLCSHFPARLLLLDALFRAQISGGHLCFSRRFQSLMFPSPPPHVSFFLTCISVLYKYFSAVGWITDLTARELQSFKNTVGFAFSSSSPRPLQSPILSASWKSSAPFAGPRSAAFSQPLVVAESGHRMAMCVWSHADVPRCPAQRRGTRAEVER